MKIKKLKTKIFSVIDAMKERFCYFFNPTMSALNLVGLATKVVNKIDTSLNFESWIKVKVLTEHKNIVCFLDRGYLGWNLCYNNGRFFYYEDDSKVEEDYDLLISKTSVNGLYRLDVSDSTGQLRFKHYDMLKD